MAGADPPWLTALSEARIVLGDGAYLLASLGLISEVDRSPAAAPSQPIDVVDAESLSKLCSVASSNVKGLVEFRRKCIAGEC
jgi:hypothetical protein